MNPDDMAIWVSHPFQESERAEFCCDVFVASKGRTYRIRGVDAAQALELAAKFAAQLVTVIGGSP
jgi:hypothetical protein